MYAGDRGRRRAGSSAARRHRRCFAKPSLDGSVEVAKQRERQLQAGARAASAADGTPAGSSVRVGLVEMETRPMLVDRGPVHGGQDRAL